jgi:CheY-like chemotaxis protein
MSARPRVLVVDDDDDIREMIGLVLGEEGFDAALEHDGHAALERVVEGPRPALILLDLMMPGMSGGDFVKAMRKHPELEEVPVVVISGDVGGEHVARALGAKFLAKPVELPALLAAVREATPT